VLLQAMADTVLASGARGYGLLTTSMGVGAVLASLTMANLGDSPYRRQMIYGGVSLLCVALVGFALSRWFPLSAVAIALAGMGMITFSSTCQTVIQGMVPDELRGRVMGVWQLVFAGSLPVGGMVYGSVARTWGAPAALLAGSGVMAFFGLLIYLQSQRERARAAGPLTAVGRTER